MCAVQCIEGEGEHCVGEDSHWGNIINALNENIVNGIWGDVSVFEGDIVSALGEIQCIGKIL